MGRIIRIAITGPESTGKSTIARQLADHYKTEWVPESARQFIDQLKRPYNQEDLLKIAQRQISQENQLSLNANKYLFCDTDLTVIKIWSTHKFGKVDPSIISSYNKVKYDLYLLMDIDLPWVFDRQREHPEKRKFFFDWFENDLKKRGANYKVISGRDIERLNNACSFIDNIYPIG